MKAKIW